jgi:outer membrane cobalamin receptor
MKAVNTALYRMVLAGLVICLFALGNLAFAQQARANKPGLQHFVAVRGKVSDARTGEGIAKAVVSIRRQSLQTVTDETGAFSFPQVTPGEVELYVSTVGYELLKSKLQVPIDRDLEADIYLGQQASKPKETVNVVADPLDPVQPSVVSSDTLDNSELKNLATVVVDDPLRSVQTLPGVATSDDYDAQFSLRGFGFPNVGVYVDGVLLSSPFHTADDIQESGSVTFFNSDVIDSLELISGGFPAKYGERTGAVLDIHTRDGSQERIFTRADIGMAGLSATNEGPIGSKASWLVSARKSYIGTLLREWGANYLAVGYTDLQGKLNFHPNSGQQFTLGTMLGTGWVAPGVDSARYSHIKKGQSTSADVYLGWNWTLNPSALLHTQVSFVQQKAWNHDQENQIPFQSRSHDISAQLELGVQAAGHFLTAGWTVRRDDENLANDYYDLQFPDFLISAHYDRSAWHSSAYLQDSWQIIPGRLQLNLGGRTEHFTVTGQNLWMPRASLALHLTHNDKMTFSWGQYGQFPSFRELWGEVYNPDLRAERATHYVLGLEHRLNDKTRIRVEAYDVRLREGIYSPDQEWRAPRPLDLERGLVPVNGVLPPRLGSYQRNSLNGHSRGIEFMLQRRSANRLSGWVSYAYGLARFSDPADQLSFWGDYDQRHTVNAYGSYRITDTINLSAKYRFGTNFPLPGFYGAVGRQLYFAEQRNLLRLPNYSRLDLRFSKAIYTHQRKLTFYTEVGNVFNRSNRGCQVHSIIQAIPSCDNQFPILPSAGMTIEF